MRQHPKWLKRHPNVKKAYIILIKDERIPCNRWSLAKEVDVQAGTDGLVRVVTLKTRDGIIKFTTLKICPLCTADNWDPAQGSETQ